jgi:competence protein ComK
LDINENYLVNRNTVLFFGEIVENGHTFTFVIDGVKKFLVPMSPVQLIKKSLIAYGSSFEGALKSSIDILGKNKKKYPIKVSASLDIWLFPTHSYKIMDNVWFNLKHVKNTLPLGLKYTKVNLNFGHTMEIQMKENAFRSKKWQTEDLKEYILNNQEKSNYNNNTELETGFMIVEKKGQYYC